MINKVNLVQFEKMILFSKSYFIINYIPLLKEFVILKEQNFDTLHYKIWFNYYDAKTNIIAIGLVLYTEYSYLFILSSIILLVAMLGVIVLNLHQRTEVKKQNLSTQLARNSLGVVRFVKTIINN